MHERSLFLSRDGGLIEGLDRLFPAGRRPGRPQGAMPAAIRFHLHPGVAAVRTADGVDLSTRKESWHFSADAATELDDSIFFADNSGARQTLQIVVSFDPKERAEVTWRFEKHR